MDHLVGKTFPGGEDDGGPVGPGTSSLDTRIGEKQDVDGESKITEDGILPEDMDRGRVECLLGAFYFVGRESAQAMG